MADDVAMADESLPQTDFDAQPYVAHKLLTSSLAVYPPLPLSSASASSPPVASEQLVAQVLLCKGKWSEQMGHRAHAGRLYLHVEEMAFLLEQGTIEVEHDGVPLSVEEMYALLHTTGVPNALAHPSSAFLAYTNLRNSGFVIMRPEQFARTHTPLRAGSALVNALAAAASTKPGAAPYSVLSIPPPQGKKGGRRRDAGRPAPVTLTPEQLQHERDRLRVMQSWLPAYDVTTGSLVPSPTVIAPPSAAPVAATGATPTAPSASLSASAIAAASPAPALTPALHALLSTPCDAFCVWLPPGGGGGTPGSANSNSSKGGAASFKKSAPGLPDFLCLVTNPWLTFERLWGARVLCSRDVVAEFQRQRRSARGAGAQPAAYEPPCLGDALSSMFAMSAERALIMPKPAPQEGSTAAAAAAPASASKAGPSSASLMPLRIAHVPVQQQRVFFSDWPAMLPPPSCIDPTQHAHVLRSAANASIFQ